MEKDKKIGYILFDLKLIRFLLFAVVSVSLVTILLSSCSNSTENMEAGAILDNAKLAVSDVKSAKIHMDIKYDLITDDGKNENHVVESMSCDIETTDNPVISHMQGIDNLETDDNESQSEVEVYSLESGENEISYIRNTEIRDDVKSNKQWYKKVASATGGQLKAQMALVATFSDNREKFRVKKGEKIGKVRCNKVEGVLPISVLEKSLKGIGNKDVSSILSVTDMNEDKGVDIKITAWFSRKSSRPVRIKLDLSEVMSAMLGEENTDSSYEYDVDEYTIDIRYTNYNKVGIISVPDEVLGSAIENEENTPSDETLKKYFETIDLKSIGLDIEDMDNWTEEDWLNAKDALYEYYGIRE